MSRRGSVAGDKSAGSVSCSSWRRASASRDWDTYTAFAEQVRETKRALLEFLISVKRAGKRVVGYGAPGKGNTLLNYCGIGRDFIDFTVDRNPYKQGKFTPGSHIPILSPDQLEGSAADYILILPVEPERGNCGNTAARTGSPRAFCRARFPRSRSSGSAHDRGDPLLATPSSPACAPAALSQSLEPRPRGCARPSRGLASDLGRILRDAGVSTVRRHDNGPGHITAVSLQ